MDASLSADGTRLVFSSLNQTSSIWRIPIPEAGTSADLQDGQRIAGGDDYTETLRVLSGKGLLGFDLERGGSHDIFVTELGSQVTPRQITHHAGHAFAPSFSPISNEVVYYAYEGDEGRNLHIANLDRGSSEQLTHGPGRDAFPDWSPTGTQIVFQRRLPGTDAASLFVIGRSEPGGTWGEPRLLWGHAGWSPRWSPDGQWVAFTMYHDVRVISRDGGEARVLFKGRGNSVWARDGKTVFIKNNRESASGIWAVPVDGGPPRLVVTDATDLPSGLFDADDSYFYYTVFERDIDIWTQEIDPSRRETKN